MPARAFEAAHAGAHVLLIRNTVAGAVAVQEALEAAGAPIWEVEGVPAGFEMARPILLAPAARDLACLLGRVHDRHGLGPSTDTMPGVHPDVAALEATWAERKGRDDLRSPSDDRTLVERALHPEALGTVVERLGRTAHDTKRRGARSADIRLARRNALDLSVPFFDLEPFREADIGTRLGARDPRSRLPGGTVGAFAPSRDFACPNGWPGPFPSTWSPISCRARAGWVGSRSVPRGRSP